MQLPSNDNLLNLLGLQDLPLANRAQLVDELSQILEVRVLDKAYDQLTEAQANQLDSYINQNQPEKVSAFMQEQVPNLSQIFAEQVEILKQELVDYKQELAEIEL